jgi:hypothetical protein
VTGPGVQPLADPEVALGRLVESLVISYVLDPAAATFTLVADYPDRAPGAQRSFVALRFSGVRGFHRDPGNLTELQAFVDTYSLADSPGPIVIQHLSTTGDDSDRSAELSFGPNFGGVAFSYDAVAGFIRHARAEERDGDWIYRDARTGEAFDFARPFVGALPPTMSPGPRSPGRTIEMPDTINLLARAKRYTPGDPEAAACWSLVVNAIDVGWLDPDQMRELIEHLRDHRDFGVEELLFAHIGGRLRVSFFDHKATCSPSAMLAALVAVSGPESTGD